MASWPTVLEPNWVHSRQKPPPLAQMPNLWQPKLNNPNPYHSSHCDRIQRGWRKWGAEYPDWYARQSHAPHPDWYQRRINTIRQADTKERLWPWELTSRPTEKQTYGIKIEGQRPVQRGYQAVPHDIEGQVAMPKWGLYHTHNYEEPCRSEPLPSIHADMKHL